MKVRKDFVSTKKEDKRYKSFLLGASVKPYSIDYKNKWVCYDKKLEQEFTNQAFREEEIFTANPKILVRQVMGKNRVFATLDRKGFYVDQSVYILLPKGDNVDLTYILGLLNSKLMYYFFSKTLSDRKETFPKIKGVQLNEFPIKTGKQKTEIQNLVEQLLETNNEIHTTKLADKLEQLQNKINYIDDRIDKLVYELYELKDSEISLVENSIN